MHTTHDHIIKEPKLWLIHNSDFSGEVFVRWESNDGEATWEWVVWGNKLIAGTIDKRPAVNMIKGPTWMTCVEIPPWVIGRAVATALRYHLTMKITCCVEDL